MQSNLSYFYFISISSSSLCVFFFFFFSRAGSATLQALAYHLLGRAEFQEASRRLRAGDTAQAVATLYRASQNLEAAVPLSLSLSLFLSVFRFVDQLRQVEVSADSASDRTTAP
jgi:ABC-type phosphate transport system permease subunit